MGATTDRISKSDTAITIPKWLAPTVVGALVAIAGYFFNAQDTRISDMEKKCATLEGKVHASAIAGAKTEAVLASMAQSLSRIENDIREMRKGGQ